MNGHIKLLLLSTMFAGFILSGCSQAISAGDPSLSPELPQPAPAFTAASDPDSISNACKKIIFSMVDQSKGENPDIYSVCPDGSGLTQLTKDPAVDTF
ncbi:MAG: hypothetical protein OEY93_02200, partial [Anaerolineae bacterium]|nr:hypothetical protein [Anaerolineae bacterium]